MRLFIEQHGESRFEPLDAAEPRTVLNRAGWRKGSGADRQWFIPSGTWREDVCRGLDFKLVARTLADAGMLERGADGNQKVRNISGTSVRVYTVNTAIFEGGGDAT